MYRKQWILKANIFKVNMLKVSSHINVSFEYFKVGEFWGQIVDLELDWFGFKLVCVIKEILLV